MNTQARIAHNVQHRMVSTQQQEDVCHAQVRATQSGVMVQQHVNHVQIELVMCV